MPARLRNDDVGVVLSGGNGLDLFEPSGLCALPAPQFDRAVLEWRKQAHWEKLKRMKS